MESTTGLAARRVERWALVAGVTGCTANGLLLTLYAVALPGNSGYEWTGPANDVVGAMSSLAIIPMAIGVRDLLGSPGELPALTGTVAVGGAASATGSALLLSRRIDLPVQSAVGGVFALSLLLWTGSVGRWGGRTGLLPMRVARAARIIAAAGLGGIAVAGLGALLPRGSVAQYAVAGPGVAAALAAFVAIPMWQLGLSRAMEVDR
jgi:hypothetical protein